MIMRFLSSVALVTAFTCNATAQAADDTLDLKPVRVDASDINKVTGLDIYKYEVELRKGQKVRVSFDLQNDENSEPRAFILREVMAQKDGRATLLAGFVRENKNLDSVLLSDDKE